MKKYLLFLTCFLLAAMISSRTLATDYYMDSQNGKDTHSGTSPTAAWQTLDQLNRAKLMPGDNVYFRRGCTWRGHIVACPGDEKNVIRYGAYGTGDKPRIYGSVSLSKESDWQPVPGKKDLWQTLPDRYTNSRPFPEFEHLTWGLYTEQPAQIKLIREKFDGRSGYRLVCTASGKVSSNAQFTTFPCNVTSGKLLTIRFRAKSTIPFSLNSPVLIKMKSPWSAYGNTQGETLKVSSEWQEYALSFVTFTNADDGRIGLFLGKDLPAGAEFSFVPLSAELADIESTGLFTDVGNIILFDKAGVKTAAFKRWEEKELQSDEDFYYHRDDHTVVFRSPVNPAKRYANLEAALRINLIQPAPYNVYEDLALIYGASHGVGGSVHHCTVRRCDISWIGGGDLGNQGAKGRRVRYGNGVEFWVGSHDNLVEDNRFSEIYDVAMTIQGPSPLKTFNIHWRNNTVYRCEQSYEIWFSDPDSEVFNVVFENNTCVDAGICWGHRQRPDKRGTHLLGYRLESKTFDMTVRNNIFCNSINDLVWYYNARFGEVKSDHNIWWQSAVGQVSGVDRKNFNWDIQKHSYTWDQYRLHTGNDKHSRFVEPKFANPCKYDYRVTNRDEIGNAGVQ